MEKREAPVIHIGMDAEGAKEAWNGILKILESKRSDHLVEIALDVYKSLGRVSHIDAGWEFHYRDEYRHLRLYPGEIEILSEEFSDDSEIE